MTKIKKKIKLIDLFAGAGGFGLGFTLANERFDLICSIEIDKWAIETLKANKKKHHKIYERDITTLQTREDILSICTTRPDIIIGGPPCQGFSIACSNKDPKDPRNSLFKNFTQWVEILQPKIFIMENVKGILKGTNENGERIIDIIQQTFTNIGYSSQVWELNAANFGVPQNRERVFIVGNKFGKMISKPKITHFLPNEKKQLNGFSKRLKPAITVLQAIGDLPKLRAGEGVEITKIFSKPKTEFQILSRGECNDLYNHVSMAHTPRIVKRYEQIIAGISREDLPIELKVRKRNGNGLISSIDFNSNYRHLKPKMVAFTIPASFYSNFIHPKQPRNITSREAARLQSFPDNYKFQGKRTQISSKLLSKLGKENENFLSQYNQIGNAGPPLLAKAIAKRIYSFIQKVEKE